MDICNLLNEADLKIEGKFDKRLHISKELLILLQNYLKVRLYLIIELNFFMYLSRK